MAHPARNALTGLLLAAALLPAPGKAADVYLDTNGVTAGSGNADATWDAATALWGDALGTATPLAWTAGDIAILAAGSDYTGTRTLTVSGTQALGGLKLSSSNTGLGTLTVTGGTLDFGATLGSIDFSAWGSTNNKNLNLTSTLVGTGGLEIRAFGDLSAGGGGNGSRFNLNGTNTFTGNVTIKSGLVAYSSNAAFGAAANRILLDGGGLLDPNLNVTLARDIEVLAGGGTLRAYGSATMTHSGALLGSGTINRTDGGTVVHSGDLSGWLGTYNVQRGTTRLEGTSTARGNWVLGEGTTGVTLSFGGSSERRFEGTVTQTVGAASTLRFTGTSRANFAGTATGISTVAVDTTSDATISGSLTADSLSMNGQGSVLRVVDGANVSFSYLNIGDGGGTSGHILQTGGTFAIRAGNSAAMRLGHWNSSGNRSSLINISGGTFDASATATLNIGWDGDGDVIVGGGSGAALFKASAIQLDANGNNAEYNDTLAILSNGTVEVAGAINAASDNDRTFLSGGTLRLTAAADTTWGTAITATDATASALDVGGRNLTLSSGSLLGSGTVNLSSAAGSLILSNAGNHTLPWGIAGSTAITKTGAGTLTFTGGGTHSGSFAVNAGRLDVASGASTQSAVSVNSAATIGGKGSVGSLTLSSGAFLNLGAAASGALTTGNLTLSGATLRFDSYGAAAAPVSVVTYTGALSGAFGTDLAVEGAANYRSTTFADTAGVVTLDLGTKNLTWSGAGGGQWNIKSATRWNSDADVFAWGDHVTFSGASANTSVTLTGELRPGSVTVAGDTNYTLTGSSGNFLAGPMALAKTGSSTLTVTGPNTFTGGTFVSQGTLIVGGSDNNALGTGAITLGDASSGANALSLLLANGRTINNTVTVSSQATGAVTLGFSGTGSSYTAFEGGLVLQRDLIISPAGNGDRLNFGGVISGSGNITIQGGSRVTFSNSNTWTGNLTVTGSGTIYQTFNGNSIPDSANVTVDSGATFRIYSSDTIAGLNGAGNIRPIAGKPTLTVGGNNASGTFSGTWTSDGWDHLAVSKIGTGTQTISGTIANPGDLIINAGVVAISGTGEFGRNAQSSTASPNLGLRGSATLRIAAGGNLILRRNSDFTGTVDVAGGTLTLGHANAVNTASVTLSGGTLAFDNRGSLFTVLSGDIRTGGTLATHTTTTNYASLHSTTGDVVGGSNTHIYNGRIYLTAGQWSFVKNFDDYGSVTVNGTTLINDATWNAAATGSITIASDGWYDVDVRVGQGGGGVGPNGSWTKGIGIKKGAATSNNADYATFDLAGVASLGSALVYSNNLTFARNISVTAASTIDTSNLVGTVGSTAGDGNGADGDLTLSGVLSGSGSLTKTGPGSLIITAAGAPSGGLVAQQGAIRVSGSAFNMLGMTTPLTIGSGALVSADNATNNAHNIGLLTLNGGTLTSVNGTAGAANDGGFGNWVLRGVVVGGSAASLISSTTLQIVSGDFNVGDVAAGTDLLVSSRIEGTGAVTKTGAGTLELAGANTHSGTTTVNAGTLRVTHASALGSGALALGGGTLHLATDTVVGSRALSLAGTGGSIVLDRATPGAGFATSMGAITFGDSRTLTVTKGANVTSGTATLNLTGLPNFGPASKVATFDVGADVLVHVSGSVNGTQAFAQLAKAGAGTLALSGNNDWWDPAGNSGLVTVTGGVLELRSALALGDGTNGTTSIGLSIGGSGTVRYASDTVLSNYSDVTTTGSGATLVLSRATSGAGLSQQFDVLTLGAGTLNVLGGDNVASGTAEAKFVSASVTGAATLNVANPAAASTAALVTISGDVSGSGNLTKSGSGTLTLSASSTLTGALVGSGGTLNVNNTLRGVSGVTATSGATVNLGAINMFVGGHGSALAASRVLTASDGGTLVFTSGMDSRIGNLTLSGGTLTSNRGLGGYDVLLADVSTGAATVNVTGSAASTMNGTGGIHLQGVQNFAVADVTGSAAADLTVSLRLDNAGLAGGAAGGVNKTGAGTLLLTGANTFTGATAVTAGEIWVGDGSNTTATLGTNSAASVSAGATLGFFHAGSVTVGNALSGAGTVAFSGTAVSGQTQYGLTGSNTGLTGALSIRSGARLYVDSAADIGSAAVTVASGGQFWANSAVTYANAMTIQGDGWSEAAGLLGAIRFNGGPTLSGAITLSGNARLTTHLSGDTGTISGVISGAGFGINKTGAGTLTLSAINTYTGGTTVSAGTLVLNAGGASGAVRGTVNVEAGAVLRLGANDATGYGTSNQITAINLNGGELNISTTANQTLGNAVITLTGGSITGVANSNLDFFQTSSALASAASATTSVVSGVRLSIRQTAGLTITVADGAAAEDLRISSAIRNDPSFTSAPLIKAGAGVLVLTGAANHSGATSVNNGTLRLGAGGSLSSSTALTVASGATFDLAGASTSVASLAGLGAVSIGSGLTLTAAGSASTTFSGSLSGSGNLAKSGGGTLTLSAASAGFSGAVTVSGSTLALGNAAAAGTGAITLDGGTLAHDVAGSTVANAIVAGSGGGTLLGRQTVDNYTTFSGALSGAGNLTIDGLVTLSGSGSGFSGQLIVADASSYLRLGTSATSSANVVQITAGNVRVDGSAGGSTYTLGGLSAGQVGAVFGAPDAGANLTLDLAGSGTESFGGVLSKNGSSLALRRSGTGTQVLNRAAGNEQNLASVSVTGGVLELAGGAVGFDTGYFTGSQAFSVSGGGTLRVSQAWNLAAGNSVSLDGGTLDVTNDANYLNTLSLAGGSTVSGALRLGNQGNASLASAGDQTNTVSSTLALVSNGGIRTLTLNVADGAAASDLAITGNITDLSGYAGSRVSKAGAGTLTLSGANTFNGGLAITAGRVDATSLGALGAGAVSVGASGELRLSLALTGALDLSTAFTPGIGGTGLLDLNLTGEHALSLGSYASTFGGSVRLTSGIFDNTGFAGNVIFAGGRLLDATAFTGTTTVSGSITDVSQLPTSGTIVLASGGSIDFGSGPAFTGTITYRGGSVAGSAFQGTLAVDGSNVAVSGGFGNGKLSVGAGNSVVLSGATTGTLVFAGGAISGGANLAGRLELASGQSLVLGQDIDALGASATLAVGAGSSVDLAGSSTAATIAFTGGSIANAQSFTGTIAVSGGAKLTTDGTVGGAVTLASGTTLAGNGTFTGTVTAGAGSILAPGSSPGVTTYGTLSLTGGSIIQLEFFSASETVTVGVDTERGYDTLQATTINFGNAGQQGGGQILLQLATLTDWEDSVTDWNATNGFVPAAGSSLLLTPGQEKIFTIARFTSSDRALTDNLNITSWFAFDTDLFEVPGATSFEVIANADGSNWELNLRVVPEPSTYGLILGGLALAGAAVRRRRRKG